MNMDTMVGPDFERGLANLDVATAAAAEAGAVGRGGRTPRRASLTISAGRL